MPESSDPTVQSPPPPPDPEVVTGRAVVTAFQELEDDTWEIPPPPTFFQRWRRGWRLVLVLLLLAVVYGSWRGGRDYYRFKQWRARSLAGDAAVASAAGDSSKAAALLDQAAILAPLDPVVMRTMADFCEPRRDIMAIYALRQVVRSGQAGAADLERLCRLALDWGHPELAATDTLKEWAAAPAETLPVTQLRLSAVWLASRGQFGEGEKRLRQALEAARGTPEAPSMEVALSRLLMNAASSAGMAETAAVEPLRLLSGVAYSPSTTLHVRTEAIRLLAGLLLHPARRELLTPVRADLLRQAFFELAALAAPADPATATSYELAATTVDLAASPGRRDSIIEGVLDQARDAPVPKRLATARWLNENGAVSGALALCDLTPEEASKPEWFTVRLDALFALKQYDSASQLLEAPAQPLPPHVQQLFLYRLDRAAGRDEATLDARRKELEKVTSRAEIKDVLSTAENLEKSGDITTALSLYTSLKSHPHAGLTARLGMVRCLDADPSRTDDLIEALEAVLQLWPQSDQARCDLAYLRLLDGIPAPGELETVARLQQESPWFLAFRITAALAGLHLKKPADALALLEEEPLPWDRVRPGWQAVYGGVLRANGKTGPADAIADRMKDVPLRPGERKLLVPPVD